MSPDETSLGDGPALKAGRKSRVALLACAASTAALTFGAHRDASTNGLATQLLLAALIAAPMGGAYFSAAFGRVRPAIGLGALAPAFAAWLGVMGASLVLGGWAINWLCFTLLWSLPAAALGVVAGKLTRALIRTKR